MCTECQQTFARNAQLRHPRECCRDSWDKLVCVEQLEKNFIINSKKFHFISYLVLMFVDSWWFLVRPCKSSRRIPTTAIQILHYFRDQLDLPQKRPNKVLKDFRDMWNRSLPINWAFVESTRRKNFSSLSGLMKTSSSARKNHSNLSMKCSYI